MSLPLLYIPLRLFSPHLPVTANGGNTHQAEQPPKERNERYITITLCCKKSLLITYSQSRRHQLATLYSSDSAVNSRYSTTCLSTKLKHWSPSNHQQRFPEIRDTGAKLSDAEASPRLDHLFSGDIASVAPTPDTSLPLWAHRFGDGCFPLSESERQIPDDRLQPYFPPLPGQLNAALKPFPTDIDVEAHHHSHLDEESASTQAQTIHRSEDPISRQLQPSKNRNQPVPTSLTPSPPQVPFLDYALGLWLYCTVNADITLAERLEKSDWVPACCTRL